MLYDVDYFIKKFEAIPESNWAVYTQYDLETGARCAFGHCTTRKSDYMDGDTTLEGQSLMSVFNDAGFVQGTCKWITDVNNSPSNFYPQSTPKQRILAALNDIKKLQTHKEQPMPTIEMPRVIHHYVFIPDTILSDSRYRMVEGVN